MTSWRCKVSTASRAHLQDSSCAPLSYEQLLCQLGYIFCCSHGIVGCLLETQNCKNCMDPHSKLQQSIAKAVLPANETPAGRRVYIHAEYMFIAIAICLFIYRQCDLVAGARSASRIGMRPLLAKGPGHLPRATPEIREKMP